MGGERSPVEGERAGKRVVVMRNRPRPLNGVMMVDTADEVAACLETRSPRFPGR